jgi:hypothetical protein
MPKKSAPKATKRGKRTKDLRVRSVSGHKAKSVKGGTFEIKNFSFGVENPTTIGSATGGAGAGKVK